MCTLALIGGLYILSLKKLKILPHLHSIQKIIQKALWIWVGHSNTCNNREQWRVWNGFSHSILDIPTPIFFNNRYRGLILVCPRPLTLPCSHPPCDQQRNLFSLGTLFSCPLSQGPSVYMFCQPSFYFLSKFNHLSLSGWAGRALDTVKGGETDMKLWRSIYSLASGWLFKRLVDLLHCQN